MWRQIFRIKEVYIGRGQLSHGTVYTYVQLIDVAFVLGSVPRSREAVHGDIDLMIVGRVEFGDGSKV